MNARIQPKTIALDFKKVETDTDIKTLVGLASTIWPVCFKDIVTRAQIDYMLAKMYAPETIRRETEAGIAFFFVELAGENIGYLSYDLRPNSYGVIVLQKIYLLPEYWSKGIGNQLIAHVFKQASTAGATAVELNVNKANSRALKAYGRAGFVVKESVRFDIGGGFEKNDYIMRKELI